jgi:CelD/BcsL family acetyltransferase involved in cellulose biosynthesis
MAAVRTRRLAGFDDPAFGPDQWDHLLAQGDTDVVYLTWMWQRSWWDAAGDGELLLIAAERNGQVVALAPFYSVSGMVYFIGCGEADYLDFLGDVGDPQVLDTLLGAARNNVRGFVGFKLDGVLDSSGTAQRLEAAAQRLKLDFFQREENPAPRVDFSNPEIGRSAANKKSLRKLERYFRLRGPMEVRRFCDGEMILPQLEDFFAQHTARWGVTTFSHEGGSLNFLDPQQRVFMERLTRRAAQAGWLRFTRLDWQGRPIAYEFGYCYGGTYFGGPSCFAIDLARRSPGQVLLRHLLLAAVEEGAHRYDFGIGDEPYKYRFATHVDTVRTWALYAPEVEVRSGQAQALDLPLNCCAKD